MSESCAISLGLLGDYYSIRHDLGHYRSACVVGVYSLATHLLQDRVQGRLELGLQATIRQHPALCYARTNDVASEIGTRFKQVNRIAREDVIEAIHCEGDNSDVLLSRHLEAAHAKLWQLDKPAWRIMVLYHERSMGGERPGTASRRIDVAFVAHHAISDGLSGVAFHDSLLRNLIRDCGPDGQAIWPLVLAEKVHPPKALEDSVTIDLSAAATTEDPRNTPVWAGKSISLLEGDGFRSRVRLMTISRQTLHKALRVCKEGSITMTGLLHSLICASLCRALGEVPGFRAVTPYSVRRFTNASKSDIVNHISYMSTHVPRAKLDAIRAATPASPEERLLILDTAREFCQNIVQELDRFPLGSPVASLAQAGNLVAHCQGQVGNVRQDTYELSNLGIADHLSNESVNTPLVLERLFMTQSGMVAGPALGINCVSLRNGPLTLSITWQHGIVEDWLIDRLAQDLESHLEQIGL